MKQSVNDKLALFIANVQAIKGDFKWKHSGTKRLAALMYALENKPIDCNAIRESYSLIKDSAGVFSMVRGNMSLCIAAKLSLNENRKQLINDTMTVYDRMKDAKFRASDFLAVAAFLIAANTERHNHQNTIERAREFYEGMKKHRWFHTGQDDYIFSVMLALSDIDPISGSDRIEQLHQRLLPEFKRAGGNSVQALCQMLALGGKSDEALDHLITLRNSLRSKKIKLDKAYTLPSLGALSLLPVDGDTLVSDILEAQSYLRSQKGFSPFTVSTQELLLFSSGIISYAYSEDVKGTIAASISTGIASIIIAQQISMIVLMTVSASAAAASS